MKNNHKTIYRNSLFLVFYLSTVPGHATDLNSLIFHVNTVAVGVQQSEVHGTITDAQGLPLAGVSISVKGTQKGTVSDFNGYYTMNVDANEVLVFSFIGFKTQEITLQGQNELNLVMETDVTDLSTVEINAGYYKVSDRGRTGNIARLDAKTIEKQPVNNPLAAMQGHLSGVNIVQSTGVPGGGFSIEIRGKNFINGNSNPLFIIDGVPFGMESLESNLVGNQINREQVSPLNSINPMDIESIEVLKDADATAIYGSRGANGVVLITTKRGKTGVTRFQTNVSTTLGRVSNFLDLMNTEQYLEVVREGVINDGYGILLEDPSFDFIWPDLKTWDSSRNTDWQKELIGGTAFRNDVQLSVSGGSDQTQFLLSGSVLKETTVFPGDGNYKKMAFHSTFNHQSEDNRFKLNLMAGYTIEDNQLPRQDFTSMANRMQPNAPRLYDDEGNLNWENNTWDNPLATLEQKYRAEIHTLIANLGISYQIVNNLELKTNFGYTTNQLESTRVFPSTALKPVPGLNPSRSSFDINNSGRNSWIMEPQLHWQPKIGDLSFSILAGTSFQQNTAENLTQTARGFSSNALLLNLSVAKTVTVFNESESDYRYHAIFGRVNIQWKDKYIINLTGRRDGSSRFGPGKQFGNFGAIGAAWLFSEEAFFKDNQILSFGKLRGSYGTTGSDNIGDYKFLSTYKIIGLDYNGISAIEPTGVFNPFFGWETNKKLEVALELGLFKDRVFLNTSWYKNRSSNQLIGIPLAATTGFSSLTGNFNATVENTGIEVDLNTINVQSEHFRWGTNFNLTVPKNKLLRFPDLENSAFANRYRIGESLTSIPMYQALGVDPDIGLYQFEDYNDDGNISALEDKKWFEDLAPEFYGGFGNTLTYKQVTLDFLFQFKKQKSYNYLNSGATIGFQQNAPVAMLNRWQAPGDISPIQRASALGAFPGVLAADEYQRESNAAISDASFIRLRNITLTYKIPNHVNKKMDVSLYLQGQNLWTITGYDGADPEQASMEILPPLQQITVGVQLVF